MYGIKQEFEGKTWGTSIANNSLRCTTGIIAAVNEWENTCDIYYVDKDYKVQILHDVSINCISNEDWFPELGEEVQLEDFNDNRPTIIGSANGDWISRKRDKQWDFSDVIASSYCGPSGYIET